MNDNTLKNIELAMNDCFDRADVCPADSDDYFKLLDKAERLGRLLNESQKLQHEMNEDLVRDDLERKKVDLEIKKYEDFDISNWKYWVDKMLIPLTTGLGASLVVLLVKDRMILRVAQVATAFEKDNTWSTSFGKSVGRFVTDSASSIMRDR